MGQPTLAMLIQNRAGVKVTALVDVCWLQVIKSKREANSVVRRLGIICSQSKAARAVEVLECFKSALLTMCVG